MDVALDGRQALERARVTGYDVIVLDRDLPEVPATGLPPPGRRGPEGRIVMLTAAARSRTGWTGWAWALTTPAQAVHVRRAGGRVRALAAAVPAAAAAASDPRRSAA